MGKRYKIWDKKEDILTLGVDPKTGKAQWTAEEYVKTKAPWAALPQIKVVVGAGHINGTHFMEYDSWKESYAKSGVEINDLMSPEQVIDTIEAWEDRPQEAPVDANERIAAALEFQNMLSM